MRRVEIGHCSFTIPGLFQCIEVCSSRLPRVFRQEFCIYETLWPVPSREWLIWEEQMCSGFYLLFSVMFENLVRLTCFLFWPWPSWMQGSFSLSQMILAFISVLPPGSSLAPYTQDSKNPEVKVSRPITHVQTNVARLRYKFRLSCGGVRVMTCGWKLADRSDEGFLLWSATHEIGINELFQRVP